MNYLITFLLFILTVASCQQINNKSNSKKKESKLLTSKYAGFYSFESEEKDGYYRKITIYPESDTTMLFYIDLNRGTPSFNIGSHYGRIVVKGDTAKYFTKYNYSEIGCGWQFIFEKDSLSISTIDNQNECDFGHAVFADGVYYRKSNKIYAYFEDWHGTKVYFRKTKPEQLK